MTLSARNGLFRFGIFVAFISVIIIVGTAFTIAPVYPAAMEEASQRAPGLIQAMIAAFFSPAPYVPFVTTIAAGLYALISMILIYYFFEKTQSPEILFVALFVLSFAFEAARIMVPLKKIHEISSVYLIITARILVFGRYFGIFSLFAASLYAAGLEIQNQGSILAVIAIATLVIALGVPIDALSWDSSLNMVCGFMTMFALVEAGIVLITIVSFLVSAYSRGSREYVLIGIGSFLAFLGRNMILQADTWVSPLPGILLLALGTWFICVQLHRVYLWL